MVVHLTARRRLQPGATTNKNQPGEFDNVPRLTWILLHKAKSTILSCLPHLFLFSSAEKVHLQNVGFVCLSVGIEHHSCSRYSKPCISANKG